jgi:hypothetical protein
MIVTIILYLMFSYTTCFGQGSDHLQVVQLLTENDGLLKIVKIIWTISHHIYLLVLHLQIIMFGLYIYIYI